jgi:hypothetical protein
MCGEQIFCIRIKLRERFWREKDPYCDVCREQCTSDLSENSKGMGDDDSRQYRRQYINDNSWASTRPPYHEDSFLSGSLSPFHLHSLTTTQTTFMPLHSINVMPSIDIPMPVTNSARPAYSNHGGSILVRAYVKQERTRDNFSL